MKRALILCLCALAATPAIAYVKPAPVVYGTDDGGGEILPPGGSGSGDGHRIPNTIDLNPRIHHYPNHQATDEPGQPLPEPGTMAMASMGLMALGATLRRRRGR